MSLILSGNSGSMTVDSTNGVTFPDTSNIISHAVPQVTTYTSGSGTYTTPTNTKYLVVQMCGGGGGGGGGSVTLGTGSGSAGGNTTFGTSLLTCTAGGGGVGSSYYGGGTNGTATINSPAVGLALSGATGGAGTYINGYSYTAGASGGSNPFGGAGMQGGANGTGYSGATNTGSGGGGAGSNNLGYSGAGGGAGGYINAIIATPSSTYSYAVGAGGAGGTATTTGGAGGAGIIIVTAYFQDINMLQNYAIIDGINVINIIQYEEQPSNPPPGFESPIIAVQSNIASIGWTYVDGVFIAPYVPPPTPEELIAQCKSTATGILNSTDWTSIPDVGDPTKANPYLINQAEFIAYRSTVRGYAVNPVVDPVFPTAPTEQWSS